MYLAMNFAGDWADSAYQSCGVDIAALSFRPTRATVVLSLVLSLLFLRRMFSYLILGFVRIDRIHNRRFRRKILFQLWCRLTGNDHKRLRIDRRGFNTPIVIGATSAAARMYSWTLGMNKCKY